MTSSLRARRAGAVIGLLTCVALALTACSSTTSGKGSAASSTAGASASSGARSSAAVPSTRPAVAAKPVHVSTLQDDNQVWGIGLAVVLWFNVAPTDSTGFTKAVSVTVNGQPTNGAWYWQKSGHTLANGKLAAIEALYRPQVYWPGHAKIHVSLPLKGVSAGAGLAYDDSLTLDFSTGAANVSTVTANPLQMVVMSDNKVVKTMKVSLGAPGTPTYSGDKVVMQKGEDIAGTNTKKPDGTVHMFGSKADPYSLDVKWAVRVTASGEYVHGAPWNVRNLGVRSTSNGCTNLSLEDAKWFYAFAQLGDVVKYNIAQDTMPSWDGYGWWNVAWSTWKTGGLLLNH